MGKNAGITNKLFLAMAVIVVTSILLVTPAYAGENKAKVYVQLKNIKIDEKIKEPVYAIRNASNQSIVVKKVDIQKKDNNKWKELAAKDSTKTHRNIKVKPGKREFDSILINDVYNIEGNYLDSGEYRIEITCLYRKKELKKYIKFKIENKRQEMIDANVSNTVSINGKNSISNILLNTDFSISKRGNVTAVVFSENDYATTKKTKIRIVILRKSHGKWKKYRKYCEVKKSNIALFAMHDILSQAKFTTKSFRNSLVPQANSHHRFFTSEILNHGFHFTRISWPTRTWGKD